MVNWFAPWNMFHRTGMRLNSPVVTEIQDECPHLFTAHEAWSHICREYGWTQLDVSLKEIESVGVINNDGTAFSWRFGGDLLHKQGTYVVVWEARRAHDGCVIGSRLRCTHSPYPPIGSPIFQMVSRGMSGADLLDAAWNNMRENSMDLPWNFVDSDQISLYIFAKGLLGTYHLRTTQHDGHLAWEILNSQHNFFIHVDRNSYF